MLAPGCGHLTPPSLAGEGKDCAVGFAFVAGTTVWVVEVDEGIDAAPVPTTEAMDGGLAPLFGRDSAELDALGDDESGGVGNREAPFTALCCSSPAAEAATSFGCDGSAADLGAGDDVDCAEREGLGLWDECWRAGTSLDRLRERYRDSWECCCW
jgi:hypothetical protein